MIGWINWLAEPGNASLVLFTVAMTLAWVFHLLETRID